MSKHALIFVHGMGVKDADKDYDTLFALVRDAYDAKHQRDGAFEERFELAPIRWKKVTERAEQSLHRKTFGYEPLPMSLTVALHPVAALRSFMTLFLGDVVAYVAEDDNGIRRCVYEQLRPYVEAHERYSIVAHSLGTLIAHDFVFHLFGSPGKVFDPIGTTDPAVVDLLKSRFHGLFTFGSPIGLFMLQKGLLWKTPPPEFTTIRYPLDRDRVWNNYWDRRDIIAYPLEPLFASNPANAGVPLKDIAVETGQLVVDSHLHYWKNVAMAASIADSLP